MEIPKKHIKMTAKQLIRNRINSAITLMEQRRFTELAYDENFCETLHIFQFLLDKVERLQTIEEHRAQMQIDNPFEK